MYFHEAVTLFTKTWAAAFKADRAVHTPYLVLGPPGIGKSASAEEAANIIRQQLRAAGDHTPFHFLKLDLSSQLPEDLGGIPKTVKDPDLNNMTVTSFAVQRRLAPFCQPGARGILVLDDITQAAPAVQVAARQTVLDRALGDYHLARDVMIIITGNRREDKSSARELPAHFRNSCCMISIEPHLDSWRDWYGTQKDSNPIIGSFLRLRPGHFSELPTDADERGVFATPRSWHKLGQLFDVAADSHQLMAVSRGLVGAHGPEVVAFHRLRAEMNIDPKALLQNPQVALPNPHTLDSPDKVNAIITSVSETAAVMCKEDPANASTVGTQWVRAVSWSTSKSGNREYLAVALNVFLSNGGNRSHLAEAVRNKDDALIQDFIGYMKSVRDHRKSLRASGGLR